MNKQIILTAALFGVLAVILGAFGAHGLEGKISERHLDTWKTANEYQFYHTAALLFYPPFRELRVSPLRFPTSCLR